MHTGMRMATRLETGLRLHPGLKLSLRFLAAPTLELEGLVQQEAEGNPLIEVDRVEPDEPPPVACPAEEEEKPEELLPEEADWYSSPRAEDEAAADHPAEPLEARATWREELKAQLRQESIPEPERLLAEYLIDCLDDRGWLGIPLDDLSRHLGSPIAELERALALVQGLEPPGVGGRDLRECLLLQLRASGRGESLAFKILDEHMDELTRRRHRELAHALHVDPACLASALEEIRRLTPFPGRLSGAGDVRYIYPDFIVERVGSGYEVLLNDRAVPRVRISASCRRLLREGDPGADPETQAYLRDKLRSARWLLSALDRRRHTLVRVMRCIVAEQRGFLEHGVARLRPMTLATIAGKVGLHESTVARVTHGKYAETPRGTFPLRFFFSGSIATELGEEVSARAVRERIRALVLAEDPALPLSDEALSHALGAEGIQIARRTIAKYREQLGIERSRDRGRRLAV